MSGVQYHITYSQILESQRRLNLSNILKQFIQTFSPTSDEFIDIACDPYIEAIQHLNSTNIDTLATRVAEKLEDGDFRGAIRIA